jgi:hypothetical protein
MKYLQLLISSVVIATLLVPMAGMAQTPAAQATGLEPSMGYAFTYQGQLSDGSNPANGQYDLQFKLFNALSVGNQVGNTVTIGNKTITNGLFSVKLDFGNVFDGAGLWLEVGVRPGSSTGSYTILSPRQEITPAPYALYAQAIPLAGSGSAATAARSDHDHFGQYWSGEIGGNAAGLKVENTYTMGGNGIIGISASPTGSGVVGYSTSTTGAVAGVFGAVDSPDGSGGYFENYGGGVGVYGTTVSGIGVRGYASATNTGPGTGVLGYSNSPDGYGVIGQNAGGGQGGGVMGATTEGIGVEGISSGVDWGTGVHGESTAPNGYGGFFANTGNGVDIMAGGSGKIMSFATTEIVVSPLNMAIPYDEPNWPNIMPSFYGYVYVNPRVAGIYRTIVPANLPSAIFGVSQYLKSIKVCYQNDNDDSHIYSTGVYYTTDALGRVELLKDVTVRYGTSPTCYTLNATSPIKIQGSAFVQFWFESPNPDPTWAYDIVIGSITLTLSEF